MTVRIQTEDFDIGAEIAQLRRANPKIGAVASFVGVVRDVNGDAFAACEFIMDYLKTRAPFWKKESTPSGARWVDARATDDIAAERWRLKG